MSICEVYPLIGEMPSSEVIKTLTSNEVLHFLGIQT